MAGGRQAVPHAMTILRGVGVYPGLLIKTLEPRSADDENNPCYARRESSWMLPV
jgi:hypothetical protein